jgi:hypothetical protein
MIVGRLMAVQCTVSDCNGKCTDCRNGGCVERFVVVGNYGHELNGIYKHCMDWFDGCRICARINFLLIIRKRNDC